MPYPSPDFRPHASPVTCGPVRIDDFVVEFSDDPPPSLCVSAFAELIDHGRRVTLDQSSRLPSLFQPRKDHRPCPGVFGSIRIAQLARLAPILPDSALSVFEVDLALANKGRQAHLDRVLFARLVDRLKGKVASIDDGAAQREWNFVIQLILVTAIDRFANGGEHLSLDLLHFGDEGSDGPRPPGLADRLAYCRLSDIRIERERAGRRPRDRREYGQGAEAQGNGSVNGD